MSLAMVTGSSMDIIRPCTGFSWSSSVSSPVEGRSSVVTPHCRHQGTSCSSRRYRSVNCASTSGTFSRFRDKARSPERDTPRGPTDSFGGRDGRGGGGRELGERDPRGTNDRDFRGRESSEYRGRDSRELEDRPRGKSGYSSYNNDRSSPRRYESGNNFSRTPRGSKGYRKKKGLHAGAYEMVDEATGETVIVWGVEGLEAPKPSGEDLRWEPAKVVASGVISDESWYKAMEASMDGPLGAYSVRGVVQGKVYGDDEGEEEDEEEENELGIEDSFIDDALDEDEESDDSDVDAEDEEDVIENSQRTSSKVTRPPRVKIFGRDFGGVITPKSKLQSNVSADTPKSLIPGYSGQRNQAGGVHRTPSVVDKLVEDEGDRGLKEVEQQESSGEQDEWQVNGDGDEDEGEGLDDDEEDEDEDEEEDDKEDEAEYEDEEPGSVFAEQRIEANLKPASSANTPKAVARSSRTGSGGSKDKFLESDIAELENLYPDGGIVEIVEENAQREPRIQFGSDDRSMTRSFFDKLRYDTHTTKGGKSAVKVLEQPLASTKNQKSIGEISVKEKEGKLSIQATLNRQGRSNYDPALSNNYFSPKSFASIGASDEIIQSLRSLNVKRPSEIQALAYKSVLEGESCIVADQTGSGKTLAYLAPLVQYLREKERIHGKSAPKRPRVIVLVPTNELANQVLSVCRTISRNGLPFRSLLITGGFKWKTQVEGLEQGADVLIATPGRFLKHLEEGNVKFDDLRSLVVDEADVLYDDEEFSNALQAINLAAPIRVQYIHVTATLPKDVHNRLLQMYPDCVPVMGPSLHRTSIGLQEILVDCSEVDGNEKTPETAFLAKKGALLQLVEQRPVSKTIIFCNKIETCRKVENSLNRYDRSSEKIAVIPHHAALSQEARSKSLEQFLHSTPDRPAFLVCTDRASRGLDSVDVEHVVLFDFPRDPSEYVRRVGRTARGAGGTGKAYVFVVGKQVSLARRIMTRNEKGHPIHSVPSSSFY